MKKILATVSAVVLSLAMVALPAVAASAEDTESTETVSTEPQSTTTAPESTEPESTEPESTEPESTEPESTEPESTEPESTEPESTETMSTLRAESNVLTESPVVKVDVCHWDQSGKWTPIEVSSAALGGSGHIDPSENDDHAFDIVEPFLDNTGKNYSDTSYNVPEYKDQYPFNGLSGAEIMESGCGEPEEEDIVVAVSGDPVAEICSELEEGEVLPGSITVTVTIAGQSVTLPSGYVTVAVKGPGDPGFTDLTGNSLTGLGDGTYQFKVTVDEGYVLSTQKNFSEIVGDQDPEGCTLVTKGPVFPELSFTPATCNGDGSYTLTSPAETEDVPAGTVTWFVNDVETAPGTYPAEVGDIVTVKVVANFPADYPVDIDGNVLPEYTYPAYEFTAPVGCDLTTLALTGSSDTTPMLALTAFLGLLGLAMVRSGIRVSRIRQEA
ncbi:MAG: hypothetical protein WBL06_14855 [Pseudolysinimonas sp.]|uniref:hypothetical protein n=1 Tax=Pseudolysinimonas sp. TaxID=2680009 RepID=UPI003C774D14